MGESSENVELLNGLPKLGQLSRLENVPFRWLSQYQLFPGILDVLCFLPATYLRVFFLMFLTAYIC